MMFYNYNPRIFLETNLFNILNKYPPTLDIGVRSYTEHYKKLLKQSITVDKDSIRKPDVICDVTKSLNIKIKFNSILFNGVIHFGINDLINLKKSIKNFYNILNKEGIILIGWNEWKIKRNNIKQIMEFYNFKNIKIKGKIFYDRPNEYQHYYTLWKK